MIKDIPSKRSLFKKIKNEKIKGKDNYKLTIKPTDILRTTYLKKSLIKVTKG